MKFFNHLHLYIKAYFLAVLLFFGGSLSAQSILENTQVRFFTDAGFKVARDTANKFVPGFQSDGIEILLTSQITDKISLLAEPVLKPNGTVSIERAMLKYSFKTYFNISAGRLYVPIGLWNTTFFRFAKALTPTIDAPPIIANLEEGGAAINKDDGIMVSGDDISKLRFGYRFMVGNGYNPSMSRKKYYIGNIFIEPVDNLRFSVSASTTTQTGVIYPTEAKVDGLALACMYMGEKNIEFAYEYFRGKIHNATFSQTGDVHYGYAGYKIKKITPYVQYYNGIILYQGVLTDLTNITLGARYNVTPLSVFKVEAQLLESDDFAKISQVKLLWAIGF